MCLVHVLRDVTLSAVFTRIALALTTTFIASNSNENAKIVW